jgi:hypothetical protein
MDLPPNPKPAETAVARRALLSSVTSLMVTDSCMVTSPPVVLVVLVVWRLRAQRVAES